MKQRYCAYCRKTKPDKGFKAVPHLHSRTVRYMCAACHQTRRAGAGALQELLHREQTEREQQRKEQSQRAHEAKREKSRKP